MGSLWLETVFVGYVRQLDDLAFRRGVSEAALGDLGLYVGLAGVFQESLFFGRNAIAGFVAKII